MNPNLDLWMPHALYKTLMRHLFPGDQQEHAAILCAGMVTTASGPRLLARDLFCAADGQDYCVGTRGYNALQPKFIHRAVTYCRDQRLVYLAVHNHGGVGQVAFSKVDLVSHERGYPALLDIAAGMPVGALVVAEGAMELDVWMPTGVRYSLREARVLGAPFRYLYPNERSRSDLYTEHGKSSDAFNRQVMMLGETGQKRLRCTRVAVVGLGGVGSLVSEILSRLGLGEIILIDPEQIELSNLSRVVGARMSDLTGDSGRPMNKVAIGERLASDAPVPPRVTAIAGDIALDRIAIALKECDYIFLAADSMRARLVVNAAVHQFHVPGIQLGSKVRVNQDTGGIDQAYSVCRVVLPGQGCLLCNGLIDTSELAKEWQSTEERRQADYGTRMPSPSVITLNSVAAAHGVNEFLFSYLGLREEGERPPYTRFDHLAGRTYYDHPRQDQTCPECSSHISSRFGRGDGARLPCAIER